MGALSCSSPSLIAVPGVCPSPCGMGAGGVGSACSWHLPRRSTRDTSALISSVAPGCCPQGMLLGVRPWARAMQRDGHVETCGGQSHPQCRGGEGSSGQQWAGPGSGGGHGGRVQALRQGWGPGEWGGAVAGSLRQDLQDQPPRSASGLPAAPTGALAGGPGTSPAAHWGPACRWPGRLCSACSG